MIQAHLGHARARYYTDMAVRVFSNNLPNPMVRAAVERAVLEAIGSPDGDWTVQIHERQDSPSWYVTIFGPKNFRWTQKFFGIEEQNPIDGFAFIKKAVTDAVLSVPGLRRLIVYVSYAPADNRGGFVKQLSDLLCAELQVQTGQRVEVLWDMSRMQPGAAWSQEIGNLLQSAQFLVPVISPSYFSSEECERELETFLTRKEARSLIFPILFVAARAPALSVAFRDRQIVDFSELRFDLKTTAAGRAIASLAAMIRDGYEKLPRERVFERGGAEPVSAASPIYVKSLKLTNFKCFREIRLSFDRPSALGGRWTCIAGINGAGKSTILQALSIALLGNPLALELGGERLNRMRRRADIVNRYRATVEIGLDGPGSGGHVGLTLAIDDGRIVSEGPSWDRAKRPVAVGYGATRNLSARIDSSSEHLSPDVRRHITLFDPLSQIAGAEVLIGRQAVNWDFAQLFQNATHQVFDKELQVVPTSPPSGILFTNSAADYVDAIDLPDGFRSAAAWLADLCSFWCEKAPDLAAGGNPADIQAIVLIDEIDLHLHPSLQRALVPRLRRTFPKVQWIVTTHSPLVVANFDANEIIALDRDRDGNIRELDRQILSFTADQIYEWLMGTRPMGSEIEEELRESSRGNGPSEEEVARRVRVSPEIDEDAARKQVAEFREILRALKR